MDQMPSEPPQELSGWKEIASHLGASVRTAQDYEKNLGLPVHRQPGEKGRVFADPVELDAWRTSRNGSGSPVRTEEAAARAPSPAAVRDVWPRRVLLAAVLTLPFLALGAYLLVIPHGPLADFRVEGKRLIAYNSNGGELWRHTFDFDLQGELYRPEAEKRLIWIGDLEGRGQPVLLFAPKAVDDIEAPSLLLCFAADGNIKWRFRPGRAVTDASGRHMVPPYMIRNLQVIVGKRPADTRIVVSSNHYLNYPNQVAFLDVHGRVVGEYWHPGHLPYLRAADLANDGRMDLLMAGVSNGNHQATLVVLDPLKVVGLMTANEVRDERYQLLGMQPAKEKAVVLFPRSAFSAGQDYTRAIHLRVTKERLLVYVAEGEGEGAPQVLLYELDNGLNVMDLTPLSSEVVFLYQGLRARGLVDHPFSEELARLKAALVVRRDGQP
jgi:hypothetical protein